jgi:hypothetical protein
MRMTTERRLESVTPGAALGKISSLRLFFVPETGG